MNPLISVIRQAFPDFEDARERLLAGKFEDVENPADGVVYRCINKDVDPVLRGIVVEHLERTMRRPVDVTVMFGRAMFEGMDATNKIHSDSVMSRYAAQIYMSEHWPDGSGTSFWNNKRLGFMHHPSQDPALIRTNHFDDWERYMLVQAQPNMMVVHTGVAWHLAEPIGGWGKNLRESRLVLTTFFN